MAYIYKITNQINQKSYIGKTQTDIKTRWQSHLNDCFKNDIQGRPLYLAIRKYGVSNFTIEMLEETLDSEASEKEIFWIDFYDTYSNKGYNATRGGDGKSYLDYNLILKEYQENQNISEIARKYNIHPNSISDILKRNNIEITSGGEVTRLKMGKTVKMLNKNTLEVLFIFPTQLAAARYLIENGLTGIAEADGASNKISLVCRGKRKTFAGHKWSY